jgi:hypothetical protein
MWLQFDWGHGPTIDGRPTLLFCAWLAWSRFRVVIPTWDRTLGSLLARLDATLQTIGGVPTYLLTDNERTITIDRIAGIAVRHPEVVAADCHEGSRTSMTSRLESKPTPWSNSPARLWAACPTELIARA